MKKLSLILFSFSVIIWGCTEDTPSGTSADDFDRSAILENWADNIIIPSFNALANSSADLHTKAVQFANNPTPAKLQTLRTAWKVAYFDFQHVSMFEMGLAMELRYRDNLNIYPADTTEIKENIQEGTYNLELPSLNNSQGFPALDYLINGTGNTDAQIAARFSTGAEAEAYQQYLTDLTQRIYSLTDEVLENWTSGYREEFVSNTGNGANASIDMMVNDYIYYYEKHLRAGKIGIPAGVFSGTPLSSHAEAYYSEAFSKDLFLEALQASQNFFNGVHYGSAESGESLNSYLDFLQTIKGGTDLSTLINRQFEEARNEAQALSGNFAVQVEEDNTLMLSTYDALQKNVVYMKVDMLQALNINVDYVDADGD